MMFVPKSLLLFSCFTSALYLQFILCSSSSRFRAPVDCFLISCGESKPVELEDGRVFQPDSANPNVSLTPNSSHIVVSSIPDTILGLPKIYTSAIVFFNSSSYTITTKQIGRHWLRLHFYPVNNTRFDLHSALFTITANGITLIHGGFASLFRKKKKSYTLVKEYAIQVGTSSSSPRLGELVLALLPWEGSVAFINGFEVLSMPDRQFGSSLVETPSEPAHEVPSQVAFETVYRIDMGGNPGSGSAMLKSDPLWRRWESDEKYLLNVASARNVSVDPSLVKYPSGVSPEIAPRWVYATAQEMADAHVNDQRFNVSWSFKVERGFKYFIRLHFCDIVSERLEGLIFNVYINNQSALRSFDLSRRTRELSAAYFVDFFTNDSSSGSSDRILVQIGPSSLESFTPNAILNGLEIMKMSDPSGSLDGKFSASHEDRKKSESRHTAVVIFSCLLGGFIVLVLLISFALFLFFRHKEEEKPRSNPTECRMASPEMTVSTNPSFGSSTAASLGLGQVLSISEIREATRNFDKRLLLGAGGFGKVYRGVLENGLVVAVKRGNPRSQQGLLEFKTEIEMLSKLRHRHLVSLIGYCEELNEMILVYEFMAGGPLRKHLYGSKLPPLSWKQRIEICIGAAKGLHYLHTGAAESIIHRDVKTTNILLDEKLEAKVADFGLSKFGPALDQTHVSTVVKGSFGYLDPDYFRRQQLTEKSDVYSFGVVLMEVLCARPAINPTLPREQVNIAEWALKWQRQGRLEQILDPRLAGTVNLDSLRKFGETAEKCLAENGNERPSMGDVLWNLEYALQLHEVSTHGNGANEKSATRISDIPEWIIPRVEHDDDIETLSDDQPGSSSITTNRVFSQILDPKGR